MNEIKWLYAQSLEDASSIVSQQEVILHAGGTTLVKRKFPKGGTILDLSELPLNEIKTEDGYIEIGSMCTFHQVADSLPGDHILAKSLSKAANTPLRNRITIGGSIAAFPIWSDLMGVLLGLEANIILIGKNAGMHPVKSIVENPNLLKNSIITSIKIKNENWLSAHYREIRTISDIPAFNFTVLLKKADNKIVTCRIYIIGTTNKYDRLTTIEEYLNNRNIDDISTDVIESLTIPKFSGRRIADADYMTQKAGIELGRVIIKILQEN